MPGGRIKDRKRKNVDNNVRRRWCIGCGVTRGTARDSEVVWKIRGKKRIKNKPKSQWSYNFGEEQEGGGRWKLDEGEKR